MKIISALAPLALIFASQTLFAQSCPTGTVAGRVNSVDGMLSVCASLGGTSETLARAPTDLATIQVEFSADTVALPAGLSSHPLNNYATRTRVGGTFFGAVGTDFSADRNTLFVLTRVNANVPTAVNGIGTINTTTGVAGTITPLTGLGAGNPLGIAVDPVSNEIFITVREPAVATRLFSVNAATGVATLVGQIGTTFSSIDIAINCTGQIFAITPAAAAPGSVLSTLNRTTAAATVVGNYQQLGAGFFQSIDFDNQDGTLYGWLTTGDATTTTFAYGSFNTTTAAFTASSTTPVGQVFGAIPTACPAVGAPTITPVTPAGAVSFTLPSTRAFVFNNAAAATAPGTVSCTIAGAGFSVTPTTTQTVAAGASTTFTVSATGAGTGTLTCTVQGIAQPLVYNLTAGVPVVLVPTPTLSLWSTLALLMGLGLFGALTVRRFS